ncbi:hypothetical protein pb186bvf_010390 [Paramecium bursaria]
MESIIRKQVNQNLQSIYSQQYGDRFHLQIHTLIEYGMYQKAEELIRKFQQQIQQDEFQQQKLIQTFINFKLYDYGIKFIDLELNAFAKQLEIKEEQLQFLIHTYFIEFYLNKNGYQKSIQELEKVQNHKIRNDILNIINDMISKEEIQLQSKQNIIRKPSKDNSRKIKLLIAILTILLLSLGINKQFRENFLYYLKKLLY